MKKAIIFISGLCSGVLLVMLWLHRGMISAAVKGEPLPEAPKGCPAFKDEENNEEIEDLSE